MRRSTCGVAIALATLILLPASVTASHNGGTQPPRDFAVGSGLTTLFAGVTTDVSVSARQIAPAGTAATGHVTIRSAFTGSGRGQVDCLRTLGNKAAVGGEFDDPPNPAFPRFLVFIEDNGQPADTLPDRLAVYGIAASGGAAQCTTLFFLISTAAPVERGNFVVHDGLAV